MVPPCTHDFLLNLSFGKAWVQGIPVYACLCPKSQLHDEGYWHRGSTFRSQLSSLFWNAKLSPQTKICRTYSNGWNSDEIVWVPLNHFDSDDSGCRPPCQSNTFWFRWIRIVAGWPLHFAFQACRSVNSHVSCALQIPYGPLRKLNIRNAVALRLCCIGNVAAKLSIVAADVTSPPYSMCLTLSENMPLTMRLSLSWSIPEPISLF